MCWLDTQYQHTDSGPLLVLVPSKKNAPGLERSARLIFLTDSHLAFQGLSQKPTGLSCSLEASWTHVDHLDVSNRGTEKVQKKPNESWAPISVDRMCPRLLGSSAQPLIQGHPTNMLQGLYRLLKWNQTTDRGDTRCVIEFRHVCLRAPECRQPAGQKSPHPHPVSPPSLYHFVQAPSEIAAWLVFTVTQRKSSYRINIICRNSFEECIKA